MRQMLLSPMIALWILLEPFACALTAGHSLDVREVAFFHEKKDSPTFGRIGVSPKRDLVAFSTIDTGIYDIRTQKPIYRIKDAGFSGFSSDGRWLLTYNTDLSPVRVISTSTWLEVGRLEMPVGPNGTKPSLWKLAAVGENLVAGGGGFREQLKFTDDGFLVVWDLSTGKIIHRLKGHSGVVYEILSLPGQNFFIAFDSSYSTRIWNANSGKEVWGRSGKKPNNQDVWRDFFSKHPMSLSPKGDLFFDGISSSVVEKFQRIETKTVEFRSSGVIPQVVSSAFVGDGKYIVAVAASGVIHLWNAKSGELLWKGQPQYERPVGSPHYHVGPCPGNPMRFISTISEQPKATVWEIDEHSVQKK